MAKKKNVNAFSAFLNTAGEVFRNACIWWVVNGATFLELLWKWVKRTVKLQWNSKLNFYQNIVRNAYAPNSRGKASMHVTVMWVVILAILFFAYKEIEYNKALSTEGWIVMGALAAIAKLGFMYSEKQKRELGISDVEDMDEDELVG